MTDRHGTTTSTGDSGRAAPGAGGIGTAGSGYVGRRAVLGAAATAVLTGAAALTAPWASAAPAEVRRGAVAAPRPAATRPLYLGTYTSDGGAGVVLATYDPGSGTLASSGALGGVADPSFLAASPGFLYAVDEYEDQATAIATGGGSPQVLGTAGTGGSGPCHLAVHAAGGHLLVANYDSGSVAVLAIGADGSLGGLTDVVQHTGSGPDPDRQSGPHAHMVLNDPAGAYVLAIDLGTDTIYTYRLDTSSGKLGLVSQAATAPGAGPRHGAFHPSGQWLYVADELGDSVTVCGYDPGSGVVTVGASQPTVPSGSAPSSRNYPAEVAVSPDGSFVYVSNRGDDSVARFAVDGGGQRLTLLDTVPSGGAYPRHIALDPTGAWLFAANQNSGTVGVLARDPATGALTPTGAPFAAPAAVCALPM